ncbi:MAG: DM13 domain-containing protein [Patescibacteria group bacterium]|nr:DM13 domain-containing protein [Patescibacteria group bacterium]
MTKKYLIIGVVIIIVGVIGYVVFVLVSSSELNELSPIESSSLIAVNDSFDTMTSDEMAEFNKAVDAMKDDIMIKDEDMPSAPTAPSVTAQGEFRRRAHSVEGKALIIEHDGERVLRFEDFETSNGPNLHIYLSSGLGIGDSIDLGKIRATKGNVNYPIDPGIDTKKYNKVLVWCVPFRVLFSYAELQ